MGEIVLAIVCASQAALLGVVVRCATVERRRLLHAVISRNPEEYAKLETTARRIHKVKAAKSPAVIPYGL